MTKSKKDLFFWDPKNNNWIVGVALIIVGGLFLLDTFNILDIHLTNWWAVFILIPGINMAVSGWRRYREAGSTRGRNTGVWGIALIIMAFAFFFNIGWHLIFPVILIGGGVYLLLSR